MDDARHSSRAEITVASFIIEHMDEIIAEWESFARVVSPASATMDNVALRDHV